MNNPETCVPASVAPFLCDRNHHSFFTSNKDGASSDAESRKFQRGIGLLQHMKMMDLINTKKACL